MAKAVENGMVRLQLSSGDDFDPCIPPVYDVVFAVELGNRAHPSSSVRSMCLDLRELAILNGRIARLCIPGSQRRRVSSGKKYKSDMILR